ncbi:MAG: hypothetical protein LCH70_07950 [Proteobacteria bacterium]|nr:hypothetical protein [Pseudomonadota bacterium]
MNPLRWLPLAALLLPFQASAQVASHCPELPADSQLAWESMDGPDFLYCKAMRAGESDPAFSVMLRAEASFRPKRSLRAEEAVIDSLPVYWYRGEVAAQPDAIIRETLLELPNKRTAHIMLRARSEEDRASSQRIAEGLRFADARLGSN